MNLQPGMVRRMVRCGLWSLIWFLFALLSPWVWAWFVGGLESHADRPQTSTGLLRLMLTIAPYALLSAGAVISVWFAFKAVAAMVSGAPVRRGDEAEWIRRLGWLQFEQLVESHFSHQGLRTALLQGLPAFPPRLAVIDGSGATMLVHYTEWKTVEVGYEIVKRFADEIAARSAQSGQLLTFGRLTSGAASLASTNNIEAVCGDRLTSMLRSSGWDASRFRESGTGASTGFGNSHSADSTGSH